MEKFSKEEEYIISESADISLGWTQKFYSVFPAFRSHNYKLYFSGQIISMIGTWLQMVAEGWLVLEITDSAFYVGLVSAAATVPSLIFSLFGGVIVDRFSKRKVLLFTQTASMILAFVLGLLTISGLINVWEIMILAFLLGSITAIDLPARQAFTFEMVDKKDLPSAIALNSAIFNGSRVIGPGIAGLVIASIGTGGTFILNGISYIASIAGLFFIKVNFIESKDHPHPLKAIKDGISYSWNSRLIKTILIFSAVISVFGFSYLTIMPVIAKNIFHIEASGLGYLFSASGLGALAGTILLSAFSRKIKSPVLIFGGISLFSLSIMIFTFITSFPLALVFMFFSGIGMMACFSTINTFLQENIENKFRGRVMSIYTLVFMGLAPLGNVQIGYFSEHFGTSFAIQLGIAIVILSSAIIFLNKKTKNALFARPKSSY